MFIQIIAFFTKGIGIFALPKTLRIVWGNNKIAIAKMIGISRVNLSNSLNGNPTLSRLREVAKILNVEVAELFKQSEKVQVNGYLEYNNKVVKIDSVSALRGVMLEIDTNGNSLKLEAQTIDYMVKLKTAFETIYNKSFTIDEFIMQMSASVEEGDVAVWEEMCKLTTSNNED